jgi:hypothetical protein
MLQNTSKYQYEQLETYKELIELRHMKTKTYLVNIFLLVFLAVVASILLKLDYDIRLTYGIIFMFVVILGLNVALFSYNNDLYNYVKISMYVNVIGVYIISTTLIMIFKTPSIFTSLFLAYAITAIYQDYKVMLLSNGLLFICGGLLSIFFPEVFLIPGNTDMHNFFILIFLFMFVMLLTLSSYILIKRKTFFYNQLAQIKESEVRNLDLLMEIDYVKTNKKLDSKEYYDSLLKFSKVLSKKIGIENVFTRKIQLLRDLKEYSTNELLEKYQEYNEEQINEIKLMELSVNTKMRNIAVKASQSNDISVDKKEIFSESLYKSFNHPKDHRYVKIISFVVFYCLLKIEKPYLKELNEETLKEVLFNSEYFYRIDPEIFDIYFNNNEVFETIINDIFKDEWSYEKDI